MAYCVQDWKGKKNKYPPDNIKSRTEAASVLDFVEAICLLYSGITHGQQWLEFIPNGNRNQMLILEHHAKGLGQAALIYFH